MLRLILDGRLGKSHQSGTARTLCREESPGEADVLVPEQATLQTEKRSCPIWVPLGAFCEFELPPPCSPAFLRRRGTRGEYVDCGGRRLIDEPGPRETRKAFRLPENAESPEFLESLVSSSPSSKAVT